MRAQKQDTGRIYVDHAADMLACEMPEKRRKEWRAALAEVDDALTTKQRESLAFVLMLAHNAIERARAGAVRDTYYEAPKR